MDKLFNHKLLVVADGFPNVSMVNIMIWIYRHLSVCWRSRKPDTEWTVLTWQKHPCLLHVWVVSHFVKQASAHLWKQQHNGGGMHFHPDSISIQILPHEAWNLFLSCFWWEKLEVMPTRETSWDNRHLLSWGQRSSCGSSIWPGSVDF